MAQFSCLIQDGSAAHLRSVDLEDRLTHHHAAHYPGETANVVFRPVEAGAMFTEGRQSTSSIITVAVSHATSYDVRERYMRGVCDIWTEVTGCTDHEIVVALTETDPTNER